MIKVRAIKYLLGMLLCVVTSSSMAIEDAPLRGSQLMTDQEKAEQRVKMRSATAQEKEMIRQENHERMRQRAEEKGVPISDQVPRERGRVNQQDRPGQGYGRRSAN